MKIQPYQILYFLDFYFKSYGKLMDYGYAYYSGSVRQLRVNKTDNRKPVITLVEQILALKKDTRK